MFRLRFVRDKPEDRTLAPGKTSSPLLPVYSRESLLDVTEANALRVADAYACVRVLADSIASLPLKVYRKTPSGRVLAGESSRAVQLLERPSPGSTSADLISQTMVHLNVNGNAYIGKFRADDEIVQLSLLDPTQVQPELRGQTMSTSSPTTVGIGRSDRRTSSTSRPWAAMAS